tara:strand:+ start:72 stop:761 length:690 start_codon:yes stop_codon:yes gene_type:complete
MRFWILKLNIILLLFSCKREQEYNYVEILDGLASQYENIEFNVKNTPLDCADQDSIYLKMLSDDQSVRSFGGGDMQAVDEYNIDIFITLIEQCGWPQYPPITKNGLLMRDYQLRSAVFLVLQHAQTEVMLKFYKQFGTSVDSGVFYKKHLAYLQDRILLSQDFPQVFGSQINGDGHLFPLWKPHEVNQRRSAMGLGTIEDYISRYGLDFSEEVIRQKSDMKKEIDKHFQ